MNTIHLYFLNNNLFLYHHIVLTYTISLKTKYLQPNKKMQSYFVYKSI